MTASWRPDLSLHVAFNADPNDSGAVPIFSDLTTLYRRGRQFSAGRQYELNETQAGSPTMTVQDTDEDLNPANTDSPYYPNVDSYRRVVKQAIWPNDGTVVNYLNTDAPVPAMQQVYYDPTFESYEVGATVPWITPIGSGVETTEPVVGTTNPRTGTQDLTYTVPTATDYPWGIQWPVPCIPGRQYTSSVYMRQSSASTQSLRVTDQAHVADDFNRTTASGWGTATFTGGAWTVAGTAAHYSTTPGTSDQPWYGTATQSNTAVNSVHLSTIGSSIDDSTQRVLITLPAVATGAEYDVGLVSRYADASNHYFVELRADTNQTLGIRIQRRVAGANTSIDSATLPFPYEAGSQVWLLFETTGGLVQAKAWLDGTVPPFDWSVSGLDATITAAGAVGCRSVLDASNTNTLPVDLVFARYTAQGSVVGDSTSTTGSYVRLDVTWTATEPIHTLQLATLPATSTAGTVLVDDLQHEQGSSPTTFTDTGPVIYGMFDGYVERWPAQWRPQSQGFEGIAETTNVDGFAPLNKTTLLAAYPQACASLNPYHYWRLNEPDGAVNFGDSAVNGSASVPLSFLVSKFGQGTLPTSAQPGIPGDPGGSGVVFTPSAAPSSFTQAATILGTGIGATPPVLLPPTPPSSGWAMSMAVWVIGALTSPATSYTLLSTYKMITSGTGYVQPLDIGINSSGNATTHVQNFVSPTPYILSLSSGIQVLDGLPHLIVATVKQNYNGSTDTVLTIYVDGVLGNTTTVATSTLGGVLAAQATTINVGGLYDTISCGAIPDATLAHAAIWTRAIDDDVTLLGGPESAAGGGWSGETSGQRITRYLTGDISLGITHKIAGAYNGTAPISVDTGMSIMGVDDLTSGTEALAGCQAVATTENGMFFAGPTSLNFSGRARRYLQTSSLYTFGEDVANDEIPYLPDVGFDWDPTLVFNPVVITNATGIIATAVNPGLLSRYFGQTLPRTINVEDNNEAVDAANYLLAQHDRPRQRVANLAIDPASNPDVWPIALRSQLNDRVTVKRRPKSANDGAGFTMSGDYFIELKAVPSVDMEAGEWTVEFQLSPVDVSQVWILEDATYGVLDETTILGY